MTMRLMWAVTFVAAGTAMVVAQAPPAVTPVFTANSRGIGALDRLAFRQIGPGAPSGRVDDLAVLESDPATFYVATATGGVHKTTNNGTTFTPVFDHEGSSSVGDMAIAPTDANLVWVGTGENNNRQSSSWGDGSLQVHRWRAVVEEHGPARLEADRAGDRRSGGLQRRARRGAR